MTTTASTQKRSGEGRTQQRERILDALFAVMSSSGMAGASVTEIAEAAGIARGALHYYFASKDEVFTALMTRLGDSYIARLQSHLERPSRRPAVERVVAWHFAGDDDDASRLLSVWIDFWGQAPTRPEIGHVVLAVQERARGLCCQAVLADHPSFAVAPPSAKRMVGAAVLAVIEGGLLQWRIAEKSAAPLPRAPLSASLIAAATAVAVSLCDHPTVREDLQ